MKGRNTYILSTRVPDGLYICVKELAIKGNTTISDCLKGIIATATGYRLNNDSGASQGIPTTRALVVRDEKPQEEKKDE